MPPAWRLFPCALAAAMLTWAPAATAAPPWRPSSDDLLATNAHVVFAQQRSSWEPHLDAIAASGLGTVRGPAHWLTVQPDGPHEWRWEATDAVAFELARRNLRWLPILFAPPEWAAAGRASPQAMRPPADPHAFARFARGFAERYGPNGAFWARYPDLPRLPVRRYEIWNEPSLSFFWHPAPDPPAFARLYLEAREALLSVDDQALAIVGGLDGVEGPEFLRRMFDAAPALTGELDALGVHPYHVDAAGSLETVAGFRRILDEHRRQDAPISVTEVGWTTSGAAPVVTESERARHLPEVLHALARSDCGIATVAAHTWVTEERDPGEREHWFGVVAPDGTPHPSGAAFIQAVRALRRAADELDEATRNICGRRARLSVRRLPSRGEGRRFRVCRRAAVSLAGRPVPGARVRFSLIDRRGRTARRFGRSTGPDGSVSACFRAPREKRVARGRGRIEITAQRADLLPARGWDERVSARRMRRLH